MISPYFEELSNAYPGIIFLKVDVDEVEVRTAVAAAVVHGRYRKWIAFCNHVLMMTVHVACYVQAVAKTCEISAMPTFQVWKNGQKVDDLVGASKDRLKALVEKYAWGARYMADVRHISSGDWLKQCGWEEVVGCHMARMVGERLHMRRVHDIL
jgi:thiol-disulfide isomerase/thioredoxin